MGQKASAFGRRLTGYVVALIAVIVLGWIALKILSGFIQTILIVVLLVGALLALNWGLGRGKG